MKTMMTLLGVVMVLVALPSSAADYERFVGTFEGEVVGLADGSESRRDLGVTIVGVKNGFRLDWVTTITRRDGRTTTKSYSVDFVPSIRAHIYQSAMKANLFGGREPLDPMKGDPYVWAYFVDETMIVNALIIDDDGSYEMQTYERALIPEGLSLKFNRIRDGEPGGEIRAVLKRVDG